MPNRNRNLVLYVVLGIVLVPAVGSLLFAAWIYVSLSGGLDDVLDADHPSETDAEVVAAERRAREDIPTVSTDVRQGITQAVPGLVEVGSGVAAPSCYTGQHNFKIDDDYDLSCTLTAVSVVSSPGAQAGLVTTLEVDEALRAAGWRRVTPTQLPGASGGITPESVQPSAVTPATSEPGAVTPGTTQPGTQPRYGVLVGPGSDLPPLQYSRSIDGRSWRLVLDEADQAAIAMDPSSGTSELEDASGQRTSLDEIIARTPRDGYAVAAQVSVEYFRD